MEYNEGFTDPKIREQKYCGINFIDQPSPEKLKGLLTGYNFLIKKSKEFNVSPPTSFEDYTEAYDTYQGLYHDKIINNLVVKKGEYSYNKLIKIRGGYSTIEKATSRAKELELMGKNKEVVGIYAIEMGKWYQFDLLNSNKEKLNYTVYKYAEDFDKNSLDFQNRVNKIKGFENKEHKIKEYDPNNDYLDEDTFVNYNHKFVLVSFNYPKPEHEKMLLDETTQGFIFNYLNEKLLIENSEEETDKKLKIVDDNKEILEKKNIEAEYLKFIQENEYSPDEYLDDNLVPCFKIKFIARTGEQADKLGEELQNDNNIHDCYLARIGSWVLFNPPKHTLKLVYKNKEIEKIVNSIEENKNKLKEVRNELALSGETMGDSTLVMGSERDPHSYF